MAGDGRDEPVTEQRISLDDEQFWTDVECSCASAFGWSLADIYGTLDLPTYIKYARWWRENPPLFMLPRMLSSMVTGVDPGAEVARRAADTDAPRPRARYDNGTGGTFVRDFVHTMGGEVRYVQSSYYEDICRELDEGKQRYLKLLREEQQQQLQ